jgi:hypothetical protein
VRAARHAQRRFASQAENAPNESLDHERRRF